MSFHISCLALGSQSPVLSKYLMTFTQVFAAHLKFNLFLGSRPTKRHEKRVCHKICITFGIDFVHGKEKRDSGADAMGRESRRGILAP